MAADHPYALLAGARLGDFTLVRVLGAGGFGITYEAHHRQDHARVALKEYLPVGYCTRAPGSTVVEPTPGQHGDTFRWGRERFMKEAESLKRLEHPSIVRVTGYFEANDTAYMALAYEEGGTLGDWLNSLGRAPTQAELDRLAWCLTDALIQVHSLGLLHRDIKPDNIMLRADLTPVLIDFGAAKSALAGQSRVAGRVNPVASSYIVVSDGYSPPEQYALQDNLQGLSSDVYALAATFYRAVAGAPPPPANGRLIEDTCRPLTEMPPGGGWRPVFLAAIDQALALKRAQRPQSALEFRRALGVVGPVSQSAGRTGAAYSADTPSADGESERRITPSANPHYTPPSVAEPVRRPSGVYVSSRAITLGVIAVVTASAIAGLSLLTPRAPQVPQPEKVAAKADAPAKPPPVAKADPPPAAKPAPPPQDKTPVQPAPKEEVFDTKRRPAPLTVAEERSLQPRDAFRECEACPEMVVVPAGSFAMGSPESEEGRLLSEGPQRRVTFAVPFAAGRFAVTFAEWDACVADGGCNGYRPSDQGWGRDRRPVINVNWNDAKAYLEWLSRKTGRSYRLLNEAEREYVTRAGTATPFWWGSSISTSQANYNGNFTYGGGSKGEYRQRTVPVDSFRPNPWGLYQVHGNVWEWTEDCWNENYKGAPTNGSVWTSGDCSRRVLRGGSWSDDPRNLRAADRSGSATDYRGSSIGLRVGRTLDR